MTKPDPAWAGAAGSTSTGAFRDWISTLRNGLLPGSPHEPDASLAGLCPTAQEKRMSSQMEGEAGGWPCPVQSHGSSGAPAQPRGCCYLTYGGQARNRKAESPTAQCLGGQKVHFSVIIWIYCDWHCEAQRMDSSQRQQHFPEGTQPLPPPLPSELHPTPEVTGGCTPGTEPCELCGVGWKHRCQPSCFTWSLRLHLHLGPLLSPGGFYTTDGIKGKQSRWLPRCLLEWGCVGYNSRLES